MIPISLLLATMMTPPSISPPSAEAPLAEQRFVEALKDHLQGIGHPLYDAVQLDPQPAIRYGYSICEKYAEGFSMIDFEGAIIGDSQYSRSQERAESLLFFSVVNLAATTYLCPGQ